MKEQDEAIKIIRANWPPENYSMLREALESVIAQIAALQKIAIEERGCRLSLPEYGCIAAEEEYMATDPDNARETAREQLRREHPEAFQ